MQSIERILKAIREKRIFGGSRKSCFSGITFFLVDLGESRQSKVCSTSNGRDFDTKIVEIKAI